MNTLTLKDNSTQPFAWMIEGDVSKADIEAVGPEAWVIATAEQAADATDGDFDEWVKSSELKDAVEFLNEWLNEAD